MSVTSGSASVFCLRPRAICIYHKGAYDRLGEDIYRYDLENGYQVTGLHRECYIDGVWNKENVEDWLTEIQLPVK